MDPSAPGRARLIQASSDVLAEAFELLTDASGGRTMHADGVVACAIGPISEDLNHAIVRAPVAGPERAATVDAALRDFFPDTSGYMVWDPWPLVDPRPLGYLAVDVPLMIRPAGGNAWPDPVELEVREVDDDRTLDALGEVLIPAFPLTGLVAGVDPAFGRGVIDHPRIRIWVGFVDGQPVSTAMATYTQGYTFIGYVATLAAARGHGYGAALTWRATLADPAVPALLHASTFGRPVYERIGYEVMATARIWIRSPATTP